MSPPSGSTGVWKCGVWAECWIWVWMIKKKWWLNVNAQESIIFVHQLIQPSVGKLRATTASLSLWIHISVCPNRREFKIPCNYKSIHLVMAIIAALIPQYRMQTCRAFSLTTGLQASLENLSWILIPALYWPATNRTHTLAGLSAVRNNSEVHCANRAHSESADLCTEEATSGPWTHHTWHWHCAFPHIQRICRTLWGLVRSTRAQGSSSGSRCAVPKLCSFCRSFGFIYCAGAADGGEAEIVLYFAPQGGKMHLTHINSRGVWRVGTGG